MKRIFLTLALLLCCSTAFGQGQGNVVMQPLASPPSGACSFILLGNDLTHGHLYWCNNYTWTQLDGGGGVTGSGTQYQVAVWSGASSITGVTPSSTSGIPLISQGSSANPTFGTAAIAGGGTGATTQGAAALAMALYGSTAAGDTGYCSHVTTGACDTFSIFAGNGTGTRVYSQNSSGAPAWIADSMTVNNGVCALGSTCNAPYQSVFFGEPTIAQNTTTFFNFVSASSGTYNNISFPVPFAGTVSNLYCRTTAAPGGTTQTFTFTVYYATQSTTTGTQSNLACQESTGSNAYCSDTNGTHNFTVAAGSTMAMQIATSATAGSATDSACSVQLTNY